MADYNNLLPGDSVQWVRKNELIAATVYGKTPQKVAIFIDHKGERFLKHVPAKDLRLLFGGKKRLLREAVYPLKEKPAENQAREIPGFPHGAGF